MASDGKLPVSTDMQPVSGGRGEEARIFGRDLERSLPVGSLQTRLPGRVRPSLIDKIPACYSAPITGPRWMGVPCLFQSGFHPVFQRRVPFCSFWLGLWFFRPHWQECLFSEFWAWNLYWSLPFGGMV